VDFGNGTIELDIKGRNVVQKSFIGVAFHAKDANQCDLVYFRPFNFTNADPERRAHAVQYMSAPNFSWKKLRTEHPGVYEKPVQPAPDPDGWFHARIVVDSPKVSVFVNDAKEPSLVVDKLSKLTSGRVGLWVGQDSDGDFANLKIVPAGGR